MEYQLIRSARKSLSVEVKGDGTIIVRAPLRLSKRRIDAFLIEKEEWIMGAVARQLERKSHRTDIGCLSKEELETIKKQARKELTALCGEYAEIMGLEYNRIAIRAQKTRWGSCSRDKNLNFNCLLMLAPEGARRYVVVHELCHLREMNHSRRFWGLVSLYCPDWKDQRKWLKLHGAELLARLPQD